MLVIIHGVHVSSYFLLILIIIRYTNVFIFFMLFVMYEKNILPAVMKDIYSNHLTLSKYLFSFSKTLHKLYYYILKHFVPQESPI